MTFATIAVVMVFIFLAFYYVVYFDATVSGLSDIQQYYIFVFFTFILIRYLEVYFKRRNLMYNMG